MEDVFSIQQAARRSGLSAHTLRYYERIGLVHHVARSTDGHRRYTQADLDWLDLLCCLRTTGMSIRDMCRYAELVRAGEETVTSRRELLVAHRDTVEERIRALIKHLEVVDFKINMYARLEGCETGREKNVRERVLQQAE